MKTPDSSSATPTFPKHDPTTPEFWDVRFDAAFTPWDQGGVPQSLANYVAKHPSAKKTLIPGCGSANEVNFFVVQGWDVTAIDFSPAAVSKAKASLPRLAGHIREQDFFGEALDRERFEVIYERAFLCALPRRLWEQWATRVAQLLPAGGRLMGFFFFDDSEKGPPFGIDPTALSALLSPHFDLVEESAPTDSISIFVGKEKWQVWQRRD